MCGLSCGKMAFHLLDTQLGSNFIALDNQAAIWEQQIGEQSLSEGQPRWRYCLAMFDLQLIIPVICGAKSFVTDGLGSPNTKDREQRRGGKIWPWPGRWCGVCFVVQGPGNPSTKAEELTIPSTWLDFCLLTFFCVCVGVCMCAELCGKSSNGRNWAS